MLPSPDTILFDVSDLYSEIHPEFISVSSGGQFHLFLSQGIKNAIYILDESKNEYDWTTALQARLDAYLDSVYPVCYVDTYSKTARAALTKVFRYIWDLFSRCGLFVKDGAGLLYEYMDYSKQKLYLRKRI